MSPIPKPMNVIELAEIWMGTKFAMSSIVGCTTVLAQRSTMRFLVLRVVCWILCELLKQIAVYFKVAGKYRILHQKFHAVSSMRSRIAFAISFLPICFCGSCFDSSSHATCVPSCLNSSTRLATTS